MKKLELRHYLMAKTRMDDLLILEDRIDPKQAMWVIYVKTRWKEFRSMSSRRFPWRAKDGFNR
jgi:hypothetical protein